MWNRILLDSFIKYDEDPNLSSTLSTGEYSINLSKNPSNNKFSGIYITGTASPRYTGGIVVSLYPDGWRATNLSYKSITLSITDITNGTLNVSQTSNGLLSDFSQYDYITFKNADNVETIHEITALESTSLVLDPTPEYSLTAVLSSLKRPAMGVYTGTGESEGTMEILLYGSYKGSSSISNNIEDMFYAVDNFPGDPKWATNWGTPQYIQNLGHSIASQTIFVNPNYTVIGVL